MSVSDYLAIIGCILIGYSIFSLFGFAILCGVVGIALVGASVWLARGGL